MDTTRYQVLLAEDDADNRYALHQAIEEVQWANAVRLFASADALLQYLMNLSNPLAYPSLVVLNVNMPGMSGLELWRYLQQQPDLKAIPVQLYSGSPQPLLRQQLQLSGTCTYYEKGADFEGYHQLVQLLKAWVEAQPAYL